MKAQREYHSAKHGRMFRLGDTVLYVGPPATGEGAPILAYGRAGSPGETIACSFSNATAAEEFIAAVATGIAEAREITARSVAAMEDNEKTTTGGQ